MVRWYVRVPELKGPMIVKLLVKKALPGVHNRVVAGSPFSDHSDEGIKLSNLLSSSVDYS